MPSINHSFLSLLQDDYRTYKYFIETGTLNGQTIFAVEPHFDILYTVEFSEKYYNNTKAQYHGNKINFILGDSSVVFRDLLPTIADKCIFFLDGHWSGGDTGHSTKDCPLEEEITLINDLFPHDGIIIIDDVRLFGLDPTSGKLGEDWSQISKERLLSILKPRISNVYHLDSESAVDDRLIIHIRAR
jgi:hypothetical protein